MNDKRREQNRINQQKYRDKLKAEGKLSDYKRDSKLKAKNKLIAAGEEFILKHNILSNENTISPLIESIETIESISAPINKKTLNTPYNYNNGMILLDMKYFNDIDYSNTTTTPLWKKTGNKALSDDIINEHIRKLNVIYDEYFKIDIDHIDDILRKVLKGDIITPNDVMILRYQDDFFGSDKFKNHIKYLAMEFIKNPRSEKASLNTFLTYINPIIAILSRIEEHNDFINNYQILSNIYRKLSDITEDYRKYNIPKNDNIIKQNLIWGVDANKDIIDDTPLTTYEKALASCYIYFPTRRVQDYMLMKKTSDLNEVFNLDYNYLLIDEEGEPKSFIFNKYKTSDAFKTQVYSLKPYVELISNLKPHIDTINDNEFIFTDKNGQMMEESPFSARCKSIFTKIYKTELTISDIRRAAETYNFRTPGRSNKTIEIFSNNMGHTTKNGLNFYEIN